MQDWIARLFAEPDMLAMGHGQSAEDGNLGLGWVYYALARAMRPRHVVVIGSWRGFVPLVFARALGDNGGTGAVSLLEPSLVDDFWTEPARVRAHLDAHGGQCVRHHRLTTQAFVESDAFRALEPVDLLFVDGYHSHEQARFDHQSFLPRMAPGAVTLFHDSTGPQLSRLYGPDRHYRHSVHRYMAELRASGHWQVFDLPLASGLSLVRPLVEDSAGA